MLERSQLTLANMPEAQRVNYGLAPKDADAGPGLNARSKDYLIRPAMETAENTSAKQSSNSRHPVPPDFQPTHYLIANPDLWASVPETSAAAHYAQVGRAQTRPYRLPFVSSFYRELYLHDKPQFTEKQAEQHWRLSNGRNYGSLHEVLFLFGFRPPIWLSHFTWETYVSHNYLWNVVQNSTQALLHFITVGIGQLFAISEELEFDPIFVRGLLNAAADMSDAELYKDWIERLIGNNFPPSASKLLRFLGLKLQMIPAAFDWRRYFAERPLIDASFHRSAWGALDHFVNIGILEPGGMPIGAADAEPLLRAIADRFAELNDFEKGNLIYDRYLLCPGATGQGIQHAADLSFRERRYARALYLYDRVRAMGQGNLWTYVNGVVCTQELFDYDAAILWLEEGLKNYPRNARLYHLFFDIQRRRLDLAVTRHCSALRADPPEASGLRQDIQDIYGSFLAFYAAQFPASGAPRQNAGPLTPDRIAVSVLANFDLPQCTYYRVTQKLEQMLGIGVDFRVFNAHDPVPFLTAASTSDIVIFYRLAASVGSLQCAAYCAANKIPTVYEIDDLVFDPAAFPEALESYNGAITEAQHFDLRCGVELVRGFIELCDYAIASTETLRGELAKLVKTGTAVVHRNVLSQSAFDAAVGRSRLKPRTRLSETVSIFYGSATKAHATDFHEQIEPALIRLMNKYPEVKFVACGFVDVTALKTSFPSRVQHVDLIENRDEYMKLLATADINIAVLHANRFNDCKSEIKWLEAAALGIPSVVSDVAVYRETLRHDDDVLITAPTPGMWYNALRSLVTQPRLRKEIGARATAKALDIYDPVKAARRLAMALCSMASPAVQDVQPAANTRRQKLLLVNVFFPPQAIGGATRIVAGEVMEICKTYADKFEVAVFCGNDEDAPAYEMISYDWNGVPVYSVNTPLREGMDWTPFDPDIQPSFEQVLDRFQPEIIHFHAIQRLSTVMIEAARARGIPYVVTVHDAWWISDHQFLIDDSNRLQMPWDRPADDVANDQQAPPASTARLRALAGSLRQAHAVLAVSETFAAIYKRAGIASVRTCTNGLPDLPKLEPAPATPGRLRIGHFGGTGYIKGLFLLKRALRRGAYANLDVLVVDLAKTHGEVENEIWGATPAKIIGRVPQDKVGWLYGQIDVLIAPSVWPESFGLVVREAVTYGKWIVTSDRGALPEAVIPDVNGFVVDLNDPDALPALLTKLQADIPRFSKPPVEAPHITTMAEHVKQITGIYDEILNKPATAVRSGRGRGKAATLATEA